MIKKHNIYKCVKVKKGSEKAESIIENGNFKIEKIVSNSAKTKDGYWYNQKIDEFVLVLKGSAEILFESNRKISMKSGDYIVIPKKVKHKVFKTSKNCVWLTVFSKMLAKL